MCTGFEIAAIALAAAGTAGSVGMGLSQASAAKKQASQAAVAQQQMLNDVYAENYRQQEENDRVAMEQKSDAVRKVEGELGSIRAASSELGLSATSYAAMNADAGYTGGLDLSRIEQTRDSQEKAITASSKAAQVNAFSNINAAYNNASNIRSGAYGNMFNSGLALGGAVMNHFNAPPKLNTKTK